MAPGVLCTQCHRCWNVQIKMQLSCSGVATPGHTRACAHVKFIGARVKNRKVKDQLLAGAIAFMWT